MNDKIIDLLKEHYNLEVAKLIPILEGADHNASVYKVTTVNCVSYFVKLLKDNPHINIESYLCEAGIKQIIPPLKTLLGNSAYQFNNITLNVYPFIEGESGFIKHLSKTQWHELGNTLRQIHSLLVPSSLQKDLRLEDYTSKWRDTVRLFLEKNTIPKICDPITSQFLLFVDKNATKIKRLVNHADILAPIVQSPSNKLVLCHADLHAGNILLDTTGNFFIVDWCSMMMAPKERDLMFIGGGVGNLWNNEDESVAFYEGYGEVMIDTPLLAYYRIERILEDIAIYTQQILSTELPEHDKSIAYKHFLSQFEPNGVIDIAFNTYENLTYDSI